MRTYYNTNEDQTKKYIYLTASRILISQIDNFVNHSNN